MTLPIVEMVHEDTRAAKASIGEQIFACLRTQGYFYLRNPHLNDVHVAELYRQCRKFMALPDSAKREFARLHRFQDRWIAAYLPRGMEQLDYAGSPEDKEVLEFWTDGGYNTDYIARLFQDEAAIAETDAWGLPHLAPIRAQLLRSFGHALDAVDAAARCLAVFLGEDEDFFVKNFGGNNNFRVTRSFPSRALEAGRAEEIVRIGAHEDLCCFTCAVYEKEYESGFQVQDARGDWRGVPRLDDLIYIHAGGMLSHWTNGAIPATPHRVIDPGWSRDRYAINMFIGTNQDVLVTPLASCTPSGDRRSAAQLARDIYKRNSGKLLAHVTPAADAAAMTGAPPA